MVVHAILPKQQWRARNPQEAKESDKRVYLKKKKKQLNKYGFGKSNTIIYVTVPSSPQYSS